MADPVAAQVEDPANDVALRLARAFDVAEDDEAIVFLDPAGRVREADLAGLPGG